ncbi:hypothetical protein [Ruegeria sp.]|uniref:hypothetical protein n=1 Tax=Ruegeria sp. TaxID=1879320 RepID=UPI003B5C002D
MTENRWQQILSNTTPERPADLDDLVAPGRQSKARGDLLFPDMDLLPSAALWERDADSHINIGVRIHKMPEAAWEIARRLAAAAIERNVVPIILSRVDCSGFEQFGFRVERIPDEELAARAAEEEMRKFWALAIIIDGQDVAQLY